MSPIRRLLERWQEAARRQAIAEERRGREAERALERLRREPPKEPNPYALCRCLHPRQGHREGVGPCLGIPCGCEGFVALGRW